MVSHPQVVVAGHICLDVIPTFTQRANRLDELIVPGKLVMVGPALMATGGAVSNTGLALHRLGAPARLMGKIGDDLFGHAILEVIRRHDPALTGGMIVDPAAQSSYTVVISPPGIDRSFLHCPGANDTFAASDVPLDRLADAAIFHFGYPTLMRRMYADDGVELAALFRRVKGAGPTTSLDMAMVDPDSDAGRVNWPLLLERVLPSVDLFLPSVEEILFMLDRPRFDALAAPGGIAGIVPQVDGQLLAALADRLIALGAAVVALKMGEQGIYLRTSADAARLADLGRLSLGPAWCGRELIVPAFRAQVVGTTGAGDCAIAGFLTGLLGDLSPAAVLAAAAAVGACNVEQADAVSGVPAWSAVQSRVAAGWPRRPMTLAIPGWSWDEGAQAWRSARDATT